MPAHAVLDEILAWVRRELMPWRLRPVPWTRALDTFGRLNEDDLAMYVIAVSGRSATIAQKPEHLQRIATFEDRAERYRRLIEDAAQWLPPGFNTILCVNVNDMLYRHFDVPVFSFQRPWYRRHVLLPDPDLLRFDYFVGEEYQDPFPYDEKTPTAVFAGATTGRWIRARDVPERGLPRLRAAEYFLDSELVDFRLPDIVQYESEEARELLAARPYTRLPRLSMREQFAHRFHLSMDGNGASCARVGIALHSNSVLMKFSSDHVLHYFHGLQPWLHYIPIAEEGEVETLIRMERAEPGRFRAIAERSREFAQRFLHRESATRYTVELLREYVLCFEEGALPESEPEPLPAPELPPQFLVTALAHVQDLGDLPPDSTGWSGVPGSGKWVEGFTVRCETSGVTMDCQALQSSHVLTDIAPAGRFCGTHGQSLPLLGFCLQVHGPNADSLTLSYEARFIDGTACPPVMAGTVCRAASFAPLEAIRIHLQTRET